MLSDIYYALSGLPTLQPFHQGARQLHPSCPVPPTHSGCQSLRHSPNSPGHLNSPNHNNLYLLDSLSCSPTSFTHCYLSLFFFHFKLFSVLGFELLETHPYTLTPLIITLYSLSWSFIKADNNSKFSSARNTMRWKKKKNGLKLDKTKFRCINHFVHIKTKIERSTC